MRFQKSIAAVAAMLASVLYLTVLSGANSPVADAAMRGDAAAVRSLIQQKADVNVPQADGATAIQWAAYRNDLEIADLLLAKKANVKLANREGATPMRLAAINGSAEMIAKLLKAGSDANEIGPNGETPLMFASRNGNPAALKVLLASGAKVNVAETVRGTTPLMWAAEQAHPEAVEVLVAAGADVKARSKFDAKANTAYLAPVTKAGGGFGGFGTGGKGKNGGAPGGGRGQGGGGKGGQQLTAGKGGKDGKGATDGGTKGGRAGKGGKDGKAGEDDADQAAADAAFGQQKGNTQGGALTALVYAARQNCIECARILLAHGADVNQTTNYGWSPLLTATQNRNYKLASLLMERGADTNLKNNGGWSPLYLATDNRNIEMGDYPTPKPDMDHMEYIKKLLATGANPNIRVCGIAPPPPPPNANAQAGAPATPPATPAANPTPQPLNAAPAAPAGPACPGDSTETRTNFTMQWLREEGATPFLRAAQSSDTELMKVLLDAGADPKIKTANNVTALAVASGIAWVEGVTFEWSKAKNIETVKMLLALGIDPNQQDVEGRTALHGAGHKGYTEVIQLLVDAGAKLDIHDIGSRDTTSDKGAFFGQTWIPLHYAQGLVRIGVQSAKAHPEAAALLEKLMKEKGLPIPAPITRSICVTPGEKGCQ